LNNNDIISSGLLELYAAGLTSSAESVQVQKWITDFPEIRSELMAIEQAMESYAMANSVAPDIAVKERILRKINIADPVIARPVSQISAADKETSARVPAYFKLAAAACLLLLIGSLVLNYNFYQKHKSADSDLQVAQHQLNQQKEVAEAMNKDMTVMTDKFALPIVLNGTPHAPDALAKIYWMKNTGEVYVDPTNLPGVPPGKQYQLWAIVDGKPVDAGMISTQKGVYHIQKMKTFGKAQAFAITLEKEGGSPTPTMEEMYVIAKI
jgi:Anti-sigma-K factor rskA